MRCSSPRCVQSAVPPKLRSNAVAGSLWAPNSDGCHLNNSIVTPGSLLSFAWLSPLPAPLSAAPPSLPVQALAISYIKNNPALPFPCYFHRACLAVTTDVVLENGEGQTWPGRVTKHEKGTPRLNGGVHTGGCCGFWPADCFGQIGPVLWYGQKGSIPNSSYLSLSPPHCRVLPADSRLGHPPQRQRLPRGRHHPCGVPGDQRRRAGRSPDPAHHSAGSRAWRCCWRHRRQGSSCCCRCPQAQRRSSQAARTLQAQPQASR